MTPMPRLFGRLFGPILVGVAGVVALAGCDLFNPLGGRSDYSVSDAAAFLGVPFPANAADIHVYSEAGIDRIVYVRFNLPVGEVAGYVAALGLAPAEVGVAPFPRTLDAPRAAASWWTPGRATQYQGTRGSQPADAPKKVIEVLVDTSDPAVAVVYIRAFEL